MRKDCFAFRTPEHCHILNEVMCAGKQCSFYKTSEEYKEYLKMHPKNRGLPSKYQPVMRVDDGKVYPRLIDAAKENGICNIDYLVQTCDGRQKTCKGYYWVYVDIEGGESECT